ncbi:MAG: tetratricopeptide repeat protein [Pseudomonadota bacterium]
MNVFMRAAGHRRFKYLLFSGTLLALLVCMFPSSAKTADVEDLFSQGNRAYAEGSYDEALGYYQALMKKEGFSASLLYNMANAYYQKKEVGQAILNYQRALYLEPGNPDIQANLRLAKKDFGLGPEPPSGWQRYLNILNLNQWTWLASIATGVFCFIFLFRGIAPKILPRRLSRGIVAGFLVLAGVSCAGVIHQYLDMDRGVIIGHNPRLLVSPFDSASSSAQLRDGEIVRITKAYEDFVLVKCPEGKSGWIVREAVEPVIPLKQPLIFGPRA